MTPPSSNLAQTEMGNRSMRIALPDLSVPTQVQAAGIGLITIFAEDLFHFINNGLTKTLGPNWLSDFEAQNIGSPSNFKDPAALLKELVRNGQSPLRKPVSATIPQANWKDFYKRLAELLGERHVWVHNSIKIDSEQLHGLVVLVSKLAWALELQVVQECNALTELITPDETEVRAETQEPEETGPEMVTELAKFTDGEEPPVGTPLNGPFLSHSYTLHLNGSVRDRRSDELLHELVPAAAPLGALLIARKPNGGRLRITEAGEIAAYFGESWGFLAKVNPINWFPDHLTPLMGI